MATVSDITTTKLANANWIDALLASGPDWNFLTTNGTTFRTTLYYTFSMSSGTESNVYATSFNSSQVAAARQIMSYISQLTGIDFAETSNGFTADIHFAQRDLSSRGQYVSGLCSTTAPYSYIGQNLTSYSPEAYVYLDNRPSSHFYAANQNPVPGNSGYETILHELGHALGLKHPFEADDDNTATLPASEDNTANTLMSYTDAVSGVYYSTYSQYDIAALNWLYGVDGLQGSWGIGTYGYYYTGTSYNETFSSSWTPSSGYSLTYVGSTGTDRLELSISRSSIDYAPSDTKEWLIISSNTGNYIYVNKDVEIVEFSDGAWSMESLLSSRSGTNSADFLYGTSSNDTIAALGGNDLISGGGGDDVIDGGTGLDTVVFNFLQNAATLTASGSFWYISHNQDYTGMTNVERVQFSDTMVALDIFANPGKVYRLYQAAFNRIPDTGGLGFWIDAVDNGANLVTDAAAGFISSPEFRSMYGANPSDGDFVALLYNNVLHRQLDQAGYDFWVGSMKSGASRPDVLYGFSESPENQSNVALLIANGIAYDEWIG